MFNLLKLFSKQKKEIKLKIFETNTDWQKETTTKLNYIQKVERY